MKWFKSHMLRHFDKYIFWGLILGALYIEQIPQKAKHDLMKVLSPRTEIDTTQIMKQLISDTSRTINLVLISTMETGGAWMENGYKYRSTVAEMDSTSHRVTMQYNDSQDISEYITYVNSNWYDINTLVLWAHWNQEELLTDYYLLPWNIAIKNLNIFQTVKWAVNNIILQACEVASTNNWTSNIASELSNYLQVPVQWSRYKSAAPFELEPGCLRENCLTFLIQDNTGVFFRNNAMFANILLTNKDTITVPIKPYNLQEESKNGDFKVIEWTTFEIYWKD